MPKLLESGEVQLHMPRTGGKSLAKDIGVREIIGTMHDGYLQIPDAWRKYPTVATFRGPEDWNRSMIRYLQKIGSHREASQLNMYPPSFVTEQNNKVNPTFGLWADPDQYFRQFAISSDYDSWYELYVDYFVAPADRIVPISALKHHIGRSGNTICQSR